MDLYLLIKLIHIISSTVFFGTGLGSAFYLWRADVRGDHRVLADVAKSVVLADTVFTAPVAVIQPVTGLWLVYLMDIPWTTSWIVMSLFLYAVVGSCWLPVYYLQYRIRDSLGEVTSVEFCTGSDIHTQYKRYMRIWYILGVPAFSGTVAIFYMMVFKPVLW